MILYFRFWLYVLFGYSKSRIGNCASSKLTFRVLPTDCASQTMNNARFFSFMDIGQHENNVRTRFLNAALKNNWRVVIRNSRITYFKPLKMFEKFEVESQVVGWDERYFYWKNTFANRKGEIVVVGYTVVSVRDRRKRIGVKPSEIIANLDPDLKPSMTSEALHHLCSDLQPPGVRELKNSP